MRGTFSNTPDSSRCLNVSVLASKSPARPRQTKPVTGCTRAANWSFDMRPRAEVDSDRWVMSCTRDHLPAVSSMDVTMKAIPFTWASCAALRPPGAWLTSRPCKRPPPASNRPATTRRQVSLSRPQSQAVASTSRMLMFCSMVRSDTVRYCSDLFKQPNSQPCARPSAARRRPSSHCISGSGGESKSVASDSSRARMPVEVFTSHVSVKGCRASVASLNIMVT
mmetsp:Transcript_27689/g.82669  ORF Transcript_27689/g.82669 Transcript_27689/m.82669 type:complete len:223 (-) Transcript_27689:389-1057(-)